MNNNCEYESYRVFTNSISSNTWLNGSQSSFVNHLVRPLKNITEVRIINGSFDVSASNVAYIKCEELTSHFNVTGVTPNLNSEPSTQTLINGSLCSFPVNQSSRSVLSEYDYNRSTRYFNPIRSIDRLTISILDEDGSPATVNSNTFITFQFTCNRENFC